MNGNKIKNRYMNLKKKYFNNLLYTLNILYINKQTNKIKLRFDDKKK